MNKSPRLHQGTRFQIKGPRPASLAGSGGTCAARRLCPRRVRQRPSRALGQASARPALRKIESASEAQQHPSRDEGRVRGSHGQCARRLRSSGYSASSKPSRPRVPIGSVSARVEKHRNEIVDCETTLRGEVLSALVSQVVFAGFQVEPVGRQFRASNIDRCETGAEALFADLVEQQLNDCFRLIVIALAELLMADAPSITDKIECRPEFVVECAPDGVNVIDRNRIINTQQIQASERRLQPTPVAGISPTMRGHREVSAAS